MQLSFIEAQTRKLPSVEIDGQIYHVKPLSEDPTMRFEIAKAYASWSAKRFSERVNPIWLAALGFTVPENETEKQKSQREQLQEILKAMYGEIDTTSAKDVGLAYLSLQAFPVVNTLSRLVYPNGKSAFTFESDDDLQVIQHFRENPSLLPDLDNLARANEGNELPEGSRE